ncbi:hypothetical protein D3C72_1526710 [compost metagenome]
MRQQAELRQGEAERHGHAIVQHAGHIRLLVDFDGAAAQALAAHRVVAHARAAQHGRHAGHHFGRIEWLDDVVVSAHAQGGQLVRILVARRQHDDGRFAAPPHFRQHAPAIDPGHLHVEQQQIRRQCQVLVQRFLAIVREGRAVAVALEVTGEDAGDLRFIFGDQDEGGRRRGGKEGGLAGAVMIVHAISLAFFAVSIESPHFFDGTSTQGFYAAAYLSTGPPVGICHRERPCIRATSPRKTC